MKKRGLIISVLVLLAVITSGFTYAYWSSEVRTKQVTGNDVTIGEAKTATLSAIVSSETTGNLVPIGQVGNSLNGAVEYVLFQFTVTWQDNFYETGKLEVEESNVLIGASGTYSSLINFTFQIGGTVDAAAPLATNVLSGNGDATIVPGTPVTVYVLVTMDEPADQTAYLAIKTGVITFNLDFEVVSLA